MYKLFLKFVLHFVVRLIRKSMYIYQAGGSGIFRNGGGTQNGEVVFKMKGGVLTPLQTMHEREHFYSHLNMEDIIDAEFVKILK